MKKPIAKPILFFIKSYKSKLLFFPLTRSSFSAILFFFFYSEVQGQCPVPTHPTAIPTHPTCTVRTGIITVNNPAPGTGVIYSINGIDNNNTTGIFPGLAAPGTYIVTVNYGQGCISLPLSVPINAPPPIPAQPIVTPIQPTCTIATGNINVNTPAPDAGISYSIDGTDYSNTTGLFPDLAPKAYAVTVKNSYGCISPALTVPINAQPPTPAEPTATSTQPGCTVATGTITVNSPAAAGISYSIDGIDYSNTTGIFPGLAPKTYIVTAKNSYNCISPTLNVTINAPPPIPAQPTATLTQPNCTLATGTITINTPSSATGISYSIDGTDYSNITGIFPELAQKTYILTVKNSYGCISPALSVTINSRPATPAQPTATSTQPTCIVATGTIAVSSPAPATGISYSINRTDYTNTTGIFPGLAPKTYTVTVKNSDGCISPALSVIVNSPLSTLAVTATAADIPCGQNTGKITINATGGISPFTYSLNGATPVAANSFPGLAAGSYKVTVKDAAGCSVDANVTIRQIASTLAATATAADIPCGQSTGKITINATGGTSPFTYSLNGATPVAANSFSGLAAGSYKVTVKDVAGCSIEADVTIRQIASTLAATATTTDIPCGQSTGKVTVNVTGGTSPFTYSLNGATPVAGNTFSGLAAGIYKVTVKDASGCIVDANVTIRQIASSLVATVTAADIPCGQSTGKITVNVTGGTSPFTYSLNGATPVAANTFSNLAAGNYKVTVKDAAGCRVDANVTIKEIACIPIVGTKVFVPTAFTPNNNSNNDFLQPYLINIREMSYFKVYNRWGQLVFSTKIIGKGWDGNINGIQQSGETYTWILACIDVDGKVIKQSGRSLLIR